MLLSVWGAGGPTLPNLLTIVSYAAIGLGFLGSPQVFVRFMSIRGAREIRAGRWVALVFTLLTDTGAVLAGLFGRALLVGGGGDFAGALGTGGELVLPVLTRELFPAVIVGAYVAAVLAATMSTIDSLLVVASSAVTHDVYRQTRRVPVPDRALTRLSRLVTLGLGLVALAIAGAVSLVAPDRTIFWYVIFGWSGIAATFCPMMILSLAWPRYNAAGALASMLSGIVAIPIFKFALPLVPMWGPLLARAEELAPSFAVSLAGRRRGHARGVTRRRDFARGDRRGVAEGGGTVTTAAPRADRRSAPGSVIRRPPTGSTRGPSPSPRLRGTARPAACDCPRCPGAPRACGSGSSTPGRPAPHA